MQFIFPNCRCVGISHFIGQGVNQQVSACRRLQNFFLADTQKFPLNQVVDNRRPCRFRADSVNVFKLFLRVGIFNVLVNIFHALHETCGGERQRRFRHTFFEFGFFVRDGVARFHLRQRIFAFVFVGRLQLRLGIFRVGFGFRHDKKFPPTELLDDFAGHAKIFVLVVDDDNGFVVNVQVVKLHGVIFRDKVVNIKLNGGQRLRQFIFRRNDCVMRGNFFVIPCTAFNCGVGICGKIF